MRPALAPTAVADVLVGAVYAGGGTTFPVIGACIASACIYMGGMVLNDLADRDKDAYLNPQRPLVVNPKLAPMAWVTVLILFLVGLFFAAWAGVGIVGGVVAALAITYCILTNGKFPADVLTMGTVRAANLGMGLAVAGFNLFSAEAATMLIAYGLYIGGISAASRAEDFKTDGARRKTVTVSSAVMLVGVGAMSSMAADAGGMSLFLLMLGPIGLLLLLVLKAGDKASVKRFVLYSLLGIYVLHACLMWSTKHFLTAGAMVGLAALSYVILRALKPAPEPTSPTA